MDDTSFGAGLRRRRKALDLTQEQLAELVGCAAATIRKLESNARRPSREVAVRLAAALQIPPEERDAFVRAARIGSTEAPPAIPAPPPAPPLPEPAPTPRIVRRHLAPPILGRETELAAISALLANPECRLLTLVGPGGIGKTRLAEAAAATLWNGYRNGVRVIFLASVARPELLAATIAGALGVPLRSQSDAAERLLAALQGQELLLVLDNLEQLLEGVLLLGDILAAAPGVQILATSRERLGLSHEWVLDVRGLVPPSDPADPDFEQAGAAALFIQAARRAGAEIQLDQAGRAALLQICQLSEGTPLALELAAAWTPVLSLPEIAQEIARGLDILTSSARDAPARHRSLRAVFDYSWDLLSPAEGQALRRLAVFRGGFSRAGALAVAEASLPTLAALQSKSLLRREETAAEGASGRYSLHELVRQYAEERLRADPAEDAATRDRHSNFMFDLMAHQIQLTMGPERVTAAVELRAEADNIRAAWQWIVEQGDVDRIARFAGGLSALLDYMDWYEEGIRVFQTLAARLDQLDPNHPAMPVARGHALMGWGLFSFRVGHYDQAQGLLSRAIVLIRPIESDTTIARCLQWLGIISARTGQYLAAYPPLQESYELYSRAGDRWGAAMVNLILSNAMQARGDYAEARSLLEGSIEMMRRHGDILMAAYYESYLANLLAVTGERERAQALLDQQDLTVITEGLPSDRAVVIGRCAYLLGDYQLARRVLEPALAEQVANNEAWVLTRNLTFLGLTLAALGEAGAATHLLEALRLGWRSNLAPRVLEAAYGLAELRARGPDPASALPILSVVIEHPASWHETCERAIGLRDELRARLDGPEPAGLPSLEAVVAELLTRGV